MIYIFYQIYPFNGVFKPSFCSTCIHFNIEHRKMGRYSENHTGWELGPFHFQILLNVLWPPFCTLATHSWLNWVDEDEVGLKEKPEEIRYIKIRPEAPERISNFCHYWELQTLKWAVGSSLPGGSWEGVKSIPRHTTYHMTVVCRKWNDGVLGLFCAHCLG